MNGQNKGKHDVFISYSTKNKNVADAVVSDFEQHGIKCWYAPRDILPGEEWVTAITNALEGSRALVLIFTDESNNSRQVMNEIAVAFNAGITIVPFRLTDEQMSSELEYYLTRVHWLDAVSKPLKKNITALREYIDVIVNTENGAIPEKPKTEEEIAAEKNAKKREKILSYLFVGAVLVIFAMGFFEAYKSIKHNNEVKAFHNAVESCYNDFDVLEHPESAIEELEKFSDDYKDKYYYLGQLYEREYDFEAAMENYEAGIEAGSSLSLLGMGDLYLNGYGVEADYVKAKEYFDNALFSECAEANYYEALIWEEGLVSTEGPDHEKALEYLRQLLGPAPMYIKVNDRDAFNPEIVARAFVLLGDIYRDGNAGPDMTDDDALRCYQEALSRCCSIKDMTYCHMGDLYYARGEFDNALEYYDKSEEYGGRSSMKTLGDMYYDGVYFDMDEKKAVEYYLKASDYSFDETGHVSYDGYHGGVSDSTMLNRMGLYYYYEADYETAAFFFTECAEKYEYVNAMANAAMAYENMMDWKDAFIWYAKAIDAGHDDADKYRKRISMMVEDGVISEKEAEDWM